MSRMCWLTALATAALLSGPASLCWAGPYVQTNLVTDAPNLVQARFVDSNLVNPWGIAFSSTSPFWIANNNSGTSTLYNGTGMPVTPSFVPVIIPANTAAGLTQGSPTGVVNNFGGFNFVFASEDGTISAWKPAFGNQAHVQVPGDAGNSSVYKGLAIGPNGNLFATNFRKGQVDVFNTSFVAQTSFADPGTTDPNSPKFGFAPFGIQTINGDLFVTLAKQDAAKHDDDAGPGRGFVDVFDSNGNLLKTLISGAPLNSPWGLALAPAGFGPFGGDLLVGNFGDSTINAFDLNTGAFEGTLTDVFGNPFVLSTMGGDPNAPFKGLWSITFGNNNPGSSPNTLFFTSGIDAENHGLFGRLDPLPIPEPGTSALFALAGGGLFLVRRLKRRRP